MKIRVSEFDVWHPGYSGATVHIKAAVDDTNLACFFDQDLTDPAPNPQILQSYSQSGVFYGKFARPIYVGAAYYLIINAIDRTGIVSPQIETLTGLDASGTLVTPTGASEAIPLADILSLSVFAASMGELLPIGDPSASASTNTATIAAAIGQAVSRGISYVDIPEGAYEFTSLNSPVVLRGNGETGTVLQSSLAGNVLTLTGEKAGIEDITIDGIINNPNSVGIYMKAVNITRCRRSLVRRFDTGIQMQGGQYAQWGSLSVDACKTGVKWHGDQAASSGSNGSVCQSNEWDGGIISNCSVIGMQLKYVDLSCAHNRIKGVGFKNNTGTAIQIVGARWTDIDDSCWFSGNGKDLDILDGSDTTKAPENTVIGLHVKGGTISGNMAFTGKCQDIVFSGVEFASGTYTLTTVTNNIVTQDCVESSTVTLAGGDATKWTRTRTELGDFPGSSGLTQDATATAAWSYNLAPGEQVLVEAKIIANGRNTTDSAFYFIARPAQRPGSNLAYDAQTGNFTLGKILTGGTSSATARIVADTDAGATGTLVLRDISGEFVDNESITDGSGGIAVANGVLVPQNAVLLGVTTSLITAVETDATFDADFFASADEVRILVTGAANKTVEWTVASQVTSG